MLHYTKSTCLAVKPADDDRPSRCKGVACTAAGTFSLLRPAPPSPSQYVARWRRESQSDPGSKLAPLGNIPPHEHKLLELLVQSLSCSTDLQAAQIALHTALPAGHQRNGRVEDDAGDHEAECGAEESADRPARSPAEPGPVQLLDYRPPLQRPAHAHMH